MDVSASACDFVHLQTIVMNRFRYFYSTQCMTVCPYSFKAVGPLGILGIYILVFHFHGISVLQLCYH